MPPHCDTKDGPVVRAAEKALETGNVNLILPWIQEEDEQELKEAFEKVTAVRSTCMGFDYGMEVVNGWFYETAVRLHRLGEGEGFTGLKPAGLDEGPVIPKAEKALENGDAKELMSLLTDAVKEEIEKRFTLANSHKKYDENNVPEARKYINAMLDFMLYSHKLLKFIRTPQIHAKAHKISMKDD